MRCSRCGSFPDTENKLCGTCEAGVSPTARNRDDHTKELVTPSCGPHDTQTRSRGKRVLMWAIAIGVLFVLGAGIGSLAYAAFGPGVGFVGSFGRLAVGENSPERPPAGRENVAARGEEKEKRTSPASDDSTVPKEAEEPKAEIRRAVKNYYEAVNREDWAYTYDNLASPTRRMYTKEEWHRKNQWFADNYPQKLTSLDVNVEVPPPTLVADVTLYGTFEDGSSAARDTRFVYEDRSWKHLFSQEEIDLFRPGVSFEEFVEAQRKGAFVSSSETAERRLEETAVEDAIRGHYGSIGVGDFEKAYSYFGPTFRGTKDQQTWIMDEESYKIMASTINSLEVTEASDTTATADVDVSFKDNTGTPRFLMTWNLVKEGGQWKLDHQAYAQAIR